MRFLSKLVFFAIVLGLFLLSQRSAPTTSCVGLPSPLNNPDKCAFLIAGVFTLCVMGAYSLSNLGREGYHNNNHNSNNRNAYVGGYGSSNGNHAKAAESCGCGPSCKGFNISPGKLCKGGAYMWQGDSPVAKMCRAMNQTEEGKFEIDRYECGAGYKGMPGCGFEYTPDSDSCWKNARCNNLGSPCDASRNGIF